MTTPAEQEAERRYKVVVQDVAYQDEGKQKERAFVAGAEWSESRYRELLEAVREYRKVIVGRRTNGWMTRFDHAERRLLAAAAALPGDS